MEEKAGPNHLTVLAILGCLLRAGAAFSAVDKSGILAVTICFEPF